MREFAEESTYRDALQQAFDDRFGKRATELPAAEREMLLGWRDVFLGMFEVQRRDGHALIVENLVDDMIYRVHSNMALPPCSNSRRNRSFFRVWCPLATSGC